MSTRICEKGFSYCVKDREERDGFRSLQKIVEGGKGARRYVWLTDVFGNVEADGKSSRRGRAHATEPTKSRSIHGRISVDEIRVNMLRTR
jgi:hypothetical protein